MILVWQKGLVEWLVECEKRDMVVIIHSVGKRSTASEYNTRAHLRTY